MNVVIYSYPSGTSTDGAAAAADENDANESLHVGADQLDIIPSDFSVDLE